MISLSEVENTISELFIPTLLKIKLNNSSPTSVRIVAAILMPNIPAPQASLITAVAQIPAAVVRPRTNCFCMMIVPAPMKPMPLTTWRGHGLGRARRCLPDDLLESVLRDDHDQSAAERDEKVGPVASSLACIPCQPDHGS